MPSFNARLAVVRRFHLLLSVHFLSLLRVLLKPRCKYKRDVLTMQENKQEKSPIKQKILLFLSKYGISQYDFYRKTGITRGVLGQNNGISEDNIARFLAAYSQVSVEWLLTGRGEMLRDQDVQLVTPVVQEQFSLRTDRKVGLKKSSVPTSPADSETVSIPREAWEVIRDQAASLKAKDVSLERKDKQIDEMLSMLRKQIEKGEDAGYRNHAATRAVAE